jgi:hypothetical protein
MVEFTVGQQENVVQHHKIIDENIHQPSCGRRAWSDHHNPSACGRIFSYPAQDGVK